MDIEGTDGLIRPGGDGNDGYATTGWQNVFLASRSGSIYSGTNEIQRNIIAERALGLPKEPRVTGVTAARRHRGRARGRGPDRGTRQLITPESGCGSSSRRGASRWSVRPRPPAGLGSSSLPAAPSVTPVRCCLCTRGMTRSSAARPSGHCATCAEPADLAFILAPDSGGRDGDRRRCAPPECGTLSSSPRVTARLALTARRLRTSLIAAAASHGIVILGPNCLGFLNTAARAAPYALTVPLPLTTGPVGIALQSGALASVLLAFARAHAIGVSTVASLGNEAMITTADMLDYLVADEQTKVICMFLEEIGDPAAFSAAALRADQAGKPIVALKAGASQAGQQAALAHTGAVAGDDAVVDAALRQLNIIRVTSVEELLTTAALLGYDRQPAGRRMGVLTASGGACDIIADRASAHGIEIPPFAEQTTDAIAAQLPSFATARNPLDVTGYVLANARTTTLTAIDEALDAAVEDPGLDFVLFTGITVPDARPPDEAAGLLEARLDWIAQRIGSAPIPVIPIASTCVDVTGYARELLGKHDIQLLGGIELSVQAIDNSLRWHERRGQVRLLPARPDAAASGRPSRGQRLGRATCSTRPACRSFPDASPAPPTMRWPRRASSARRWRSRSVPLP